MNKFFRLLYQPYKWLFFIPFLIINTLILALIAITIAFISSKASSVLGVIWARINSYFTPIIVHVTGRKNVNKNISYIIVANHQSHYDIFAIYGWLGIDFKWVMKQELRKVPGLGIACEKMGHIFIDRANRKNAIDTLNNAKEKLVNGTSIVIFPEGTRSKIGEMNSFKKGAFNLALDLQLPILPITLIGTNKILPADTIRIYPGKVEMIIHEPLDITKYTSANISELMNDVRSVIEKPLC